MSEAATTSSVQPLSPDEHRVADRALRRVHEQLATFLRGLPAHARSASGLARLLGVDRTTCQRLVFIANRPYAGLASVEKLPGVRGLRSLLEAGSNCSDGLDRETLDQLGASIDLLEECFTNLGGSQSALIRRIAASGPMEAQPVVNSNSLQARHQLFDAAAALTGRCSRTWVAVYAYLPHTGPAERSMEVARVHGLIGHQARADAVPLTFHNFAIGKSDNESHRFRSLVDSGDGNRPTTVIPEFSTNPLPVVSSRQPEEYLVQAIDTRQEPAEQAFDVMFGTRNRTSRPDRRSPPLEEAWAMINFPVRRMVFDIYLHRDLARACIPALDVHLWRPDFAAHPGDRWQTRFSEAPRLELLGSGIDNAATDAYPRHQELSAFLFEQIGQHHGEFVGFRCTTEYPMWRTGYCMSFDFGGN